MSGEYRVICKRSEKISILEDRIRNARASGKGSFAGDFLELFHESVRRLLIFKSIRPSGGLARRIMVVGNSGCGKTTFINGLLGESVFQIGADVMSSDTCTFSVCDSLIRISDRAPVTLRVFDTVGFNDTLLEGNEKILNQLFASEITELDFFLVCVPAGRDNVMESRLKDSHKFLQKFPAVQAKNIVIVVTKVTEDDREAVQALFESGSLPMHLFGELPLFHNSSVFLTNFPDISKELRKEKVAWSTLELKCQRMASDRQLILSHVMRNVDQVHTRLPEQTVHQLFDEYNLFYKILEKQGVKEI
jgi:GTPase Era involved in 16S rRNA processing